MKASVNYVGTSSMIIGIRVESENIQTGKIKHCNSSYFTMVAKSSNGSTIQVPKLLISNYDEVRRFYNCIKQIALKKDRNLHEEFFDYKSLDALNSLENYNVKVNII